MSNKGGLTPHSVGHSPRPDREDDGHMLVADPRFAGASRWSSLPWLGHAPGIRVPPPTGACGTSSAGNHLPGTMRAMPTVIPRAGHYTEIGVLRVTSVNTQKERLGIYYDDGFGRPGELLFDAGETIAATGTTDTGYFMIQPPVTFWLPAGVLWLAMTPQGNSPTGTYFATLAASTGQTFAIGNATPTTTQQNSGYAGKTGITGALPTAWGSTFTQSATMPVIYLRRTT